MTIEYSIPQASDIFNLRVHALARFTDSTGWTAFNPSITYSPEHGYLVLIRSANYILQDHRKERNMAIGREIESPDSFEDPNEWDGLGMFTAPWNGGNHFRNRMFIAKLDTKKLVIGSLHEIDTSQSEAAAPVQIKRGLEDGRIYYDGESLRISCTAFEYYFVPYARICNIKLNLTSLDKAYTTEFNMFESPRGADVVEKNWMPVEKGLMSAESRPKWDYIYDAGKTYTIATNSMQEVGGFDVPLRGGSQLVPLEDGTFLAITHQVFEVSFMRSSDIKKPIISRRRYGHRFVQYTADGQVIKVSDPFNFLNKSIEFAAGMAINGDKVLVTFGALDCAAYIAEFDLREVLASLRRPRISAS